MEKYGEPVPLLQEQTMTERDLKYCQDTGGANGQLGINQGNESENRGPYGLAVSTMNMNTIRRETDLEGRYEIMVPGEHEIGGLGNLTPEESLQSPIPCWNATEANLLSEIHATQATVTLIQEHEQGNVNLASIEGYQKDRAEAEIENDEDYFFPSPEELEKARPPEVGMVFATIQDAQRFINVYGLVTGFTVIKGTYYKHQKITFQCNKSGKAMETETGQKKRRRDLIERTGCPMKVLVKLIAGRWEIAEVVSEHNHPLHCSPLLSRFFMSHKYMTEDERNFSRILQESRIKPSKIMELFTNLRDSLKNIHARKADVNNLEQSDRLTKTRNRDIESALEHIRILQKEQPGFYYAVKTQEGNNIKSIFWTDAQARLDYALYGDYIYLDTAYSTVENNMPFVPLIGINGHGKTIVFGWTLLEDAKVETFSWLFTTFLDVMNGSKPSIIVTHQDPAMQKSIAEVFPTVLHRFSMWHVMRQAAAEFGGFMANKPGMADELRGLITNSLTTEEFEDSWNAMLEKYDAASVTHLKLMYQTRLMWAPVYFKHVFCPFIRCETTNSIFKEYVLREDTIETFMGQYSLFHKEAVSIEGDRFESTSKKPTYCTRQPIERHAAEIYTMGMFLKFQKELLDAAAFSVHEKEKNTIYVVTKALEYEEAEFTRDSLSIDVDLKTNMFSCICSKFQRDGILCSHVLRLLTQFSINMIPEHYINQKWTKKFKEQQLQKLCEKTGSNFSQNAFRYAMLMNKGAEICATVSKDANHCKVFVEELERVRQKLASR